MIVTITPSPALDRTLILDGPNTPGRLHRVREALEFAGGKGLNVARAISRLGGRAVAAAPLGGERGRTFLARAEAEGIELIAVDADAETRCCTIVVQTEPAHPTEFNEPGAPVDDGAWSVLSATIAERRPSYVAVCGSLPAGTTPTVLLDALTERLRTELLVVDGGGALLRAAVQRRIRLIAPNREELRQLCRELAWPESDHAAARRVWSDYGVEVLFSDGDRGATWYGPIDVAARSIPVRDGNPVGSGDTLLGALLAKVQGDGLDREWPSSATERMSVIRWAVAAATANVVAGGGARIDPEEVQAQWASSEAWVVEENHDRD